jgi:hypothetical protein
MVCLSGRRNRKGEKAGKGSNLYTEKVRFGSVTFERNLLI